MAVNQLRVVMSVLKEVSEGNIPKAEDYGIKKKFSTIFLMPCKMMVL